MDESFEDKIKRISEQGAKSGPEKEEEIDEDRVLRVFARMHERTGFAPTMEHVEPLKDYLRGYALRLHGGVGSGKTFFFQSLGIRLIEASRIASLGKGAFVWMREYSDGHQVCIDDLGAEPTVNDMGTKFEVLAEIVNHRAANGFKTHFTMNLTGPEISARYGERIVSRLMLCKRHELKTANRRKPKVYEA